MQEIYAKISNAKLLPLNRVTSDSCSKSCKQGDYKPYVLQLTRGNAVIMKYIAGQLADTVLNLLII